jgi:UTP--glucose-1-phosphate uridylyltransferase
MLPATKVTAKELLPVYDRPVIQFAVDEAIAAGASRIIVVVSAEKPAIRAFLGDVASASSGKGESEPEILYVTQEEAAGLGHAVLCCKGLTLPGPFGVILPDDIISGRSCLAEMGEHFRDGNMVAAMNVPSSETSKYGIFSFTGPATDICIPVTGIVEKPRPGAAPSLVAAVGRYILQPMIFEVLEHTEMGAGGEVQLTDAIAIATRTVPLTAFRFSGVRYDCGSHDGLLAASNARQASIKKGAIQSPESIAFSYTRSRTEGNANGKDQPAMFSAAGDTSCHAA